MATGGIWLSHGSGKNVRKVWIPIRAYTIQQRQAARQAR